MDGGIMVSTILVLTLLLSFNVEEKNIEKSQARNKNKTFMLNASFLFY